MSIKAVFEGRVLYSDKLVQGDLITSPNGLILSIMVNESRVIPEHERYFILSKEKEDKYFFANKVHKVDPDSVKLIEYRAN